MSVSFYYSETCSHCQEIYPFVREQVDKYATYPFGLYEISNDKKNHDAFAKENFKGVPAFVIKTNDCRTIKFMGADKRKLHCELQEMTTMECLTYPAGNSIKESWFVVE